MITSLTELDRIDLDGWPILYVVVPHADTAQAHRHLAGKGYVPEQMNDDGVFQFHHPDGPRP